MLTHVIAARRLCSARPATAAATMHRQQPRRKDLAARITASLHYTFPLRRRRRGGEDGMNGALVLSLSGSDGQIELRALIWSYEH
jgi:hypothetical protein